MLEHPDRDDCEVLVANGAVLRGALSLLDGGWWRLQGAGGVIDLNPQQVIGVGAPGSWAAAGGGSAVKEAGGGRAPRTNRGGAGRPWRDEELRLLANAYLDGVTDKELAQEFSRTPAIIKQLRQGFECARGNLVEDQISEVAASWVHRWRRVLAPE